MATYSTNQFKSGLKIMLDGQPCNIIENEFVKPGKGQAFNRVKIRNLLNGRVVERTFKSGEAIEAADVVEQTMQYLYNDGEYWHFMNETTFEQTMASKTAMGDSANWLKEQATCTLTLWNDDVIAVQPPTFVELTINNTPPGVRGDTVSGGSKPATLETGVVVQVPLFVSQGEIIKIDTRTGDYVSRVAS